MTRRGKGREATQVERLGGRSRRFGRPSHPHRGRRPPGVLSSLPQSVAQPGNERFV